MADFGRDLLAGDFGALQVLFAICMPIFFIASAFTVWARRRSGPVQPLARVPLTGGSVDGAAVVPGSLTVVRRMVIVSAVLLFMTFLALAAPRAMKALEDRTPCVELDSELGQALCSDGLVDPNDARDRAVRELGVLLLGSAAALVLLTTVWLVSGPSLTAASLTQQSVAKDSLTPPRTIGPTEEMRSSAGDGGRLPSGSVERRLQELKRLRAEELISQEQYEVKQQEVLDAI